jgi:hypothetical protein
MVQSELADDLGMSSIRAALCAVCLGSFGMAYNRLKLRQALIVKGSYLQDFIVYCLPLCCFAVAQEHRQLKTSKSARTPYRHSLSPLASRSKDSQTNLHDAASVEIDEGVRHKVHNFKPPSLNTADQEAAFKSDLHLELKKLAEPETAGRELSTRSLGAEGAEMAM